LGGRAAAEGNVAVCQALASPQKTLPNPEITSILEKSPDSLTCIGFWKNSCFSVGLLHFLSACERSANSLKSVQVEFLGPETAGEEFLRA